MMKPSQFDGHRRIYSFQLETWNLQPATKKSCRVFLFQSSIVNFGTLSIYIYIIIYITFQGTNISPTKALLKMISSSIGGIC